jgi:hypothetical protein
VTVSKLIPPDLCVSGSESVQYTDRSRLAGRNALCYDPLRSSSGSVGRAHEATRLLARAGISDSAMKPRPIVIMSPPATAVTQKPGPGPVFGRVEAGGGPDPTPTVAGVTDAVWTVVVVLEAACNVVVVLEAGCNVVVVVEGGGTSVANTFSKVAARTACPASFV